MKILRRLTCGTAVWVLLASVHFAQTTQAPKTGQKAGEAKSDSSSKSGTPQSPDPTAKAGTSQGADAAPKPQQTPAAQSSGAAGQDSQANKGVAQTGMDRPAILVQADTDEATTKILLRVDAKPVQSDLETGLLTSTQFPKLQVRPSVTLVGDAEPGKAGEFLVQLKIGGLVAFGDSSTPLLYKGRQVELLRFSKPGLFAKPPVGDAFVAREGEPLTILLENPSAFGYSNVRARLRFENEDVCLFKSESFRQAASTAGQPDASQPQSCDANSKWTEFEIPQYAQVSLHADPSTSWFFDSATGYARSAKRKGWLTLRFAKANAPQIQEQNLPLEIQFEPASRSLFWSLLKVALWLLVGALLSLVLRVSVPNIKRKSKLKDQLNEAAKLISTISTEVDSNLRVLLRVERRALDELRLAVWPFGPGYADYAKRVEEGLPTLNRRIDAVLRLDEALIRKKTLTEHSAAPTRLEQVEEMLGAVSETLKQDQLSEEEWVLVKQRLENAQKLLRDPTQAEKEAFEGMLSRRWKAIANHFGRDTTGKLLVPATLQGMEGCFPEPSLLPVTTDADGAQWLDSVGVVRADLQLSALELVWEFQFLSPAGGAPSERWKTAKTELNQLLSTPAIDNLGQAKRLLQQLAEGVQEDDIVKALEAGRATLSMDPSIARPDQTIRFSVQFRQTQPNLNTAAAREQISCHWVFKDVSSFRRRGIRRWLAEGGEKDSSLEIPEEGWHVHHYFERGVHTSTITVRFFKSNGDLIELKQGQNFPVLEAHPTVRRRGKENWQRFGMELTQLSAALLVPLATLASTTINGGTSGHWWELVAIGFASDTIKNILVGKDDTQTTSPAAGK